MYVCVVGEHDGVMKVTDWQKTYYAADSGIQSGATTVRADDDGTEYSKKYTYTSTTTTVTEDPAGEKCTHYMLLIASFYIGATCFITTCYTLYPH